MTIDYIMKDALKTVHWAKSELMLQFTNWHQQLLCTAMQLTDMCIEGDEGDEGNFDYDRRIMTMMKKRVLRIPTRIR